VSLIPTVFRSTDPGAPILTGTAGSFAALMDAVLVTGYGTGAEAKAPLGWTRAFSDGNKRAYHNSLSDGGTGMFWRIDDSNAQYVLCSAFHTMSSVDAGTDQFGGGANAWGKSITANTTPRRWVIVGNARTVYVMIAAGYQWVGVDVSNCHWVGDYECLNKDFLFNFGVSRTGISVVTTGPSSSGILVANGAYGEFVGARHYSGAPVGSQMLCRNSLVSSQANLGANGGLAYPYPPTGGMVASRVCLNNGGLLFGFPPGLWAPEHARVLTRHAVYSDVSGLPGDWLAIENFANTLTCQGLLQLSGEWTY
jgi:hypothetical protein